MIKVQYLVSRRGGLECAAFAGPIAAWIYAVGLTVVYFDRVSVVCGANMRGEVR